MASRSAIAKRIPQMRRVARIMLGNRTRGDDLVEHTLRRGLVEPQDTGAETSLPVQLFRAMWTIMLNDYDNYRTGSARTPGATAPSAPPPRPANGAGAGAGAGAGEQGNDGADRRTGDPGALEQGLALMPAEMRLTLVLIVIQGMSYEEVALVTAADVATVRARLNQAREILQHWMEGSGTASSVPMEGKVTHVAGD